MVSLLGPLWLCNIWPDKQCLYQVNVNLAGLPALVLPCGLVEGGPAGLPVGLQMIGAAFDEVRNNLTCSSLRSTYISID